MGGGESKVFGFDICDFGYFCSDSGIVFVGEDADVEIDYRYFEVAVGYIEGGGVEGHVDALGSLVGCGTPACVGDAYGWCDVCSSGAGCEHFDEGLSFGTGRARRIWVPFMRLRLAGQSISFSLVC